jgi:hypothetical protein
MPVCIAGMHRSGTSMVTKMLQTSGLYLGPESDLMPSKSDNQEPHWENKRFVNVNVAILAQLYGAWDCPPPIPNDWTTGRLAAFQTQAQELLADFDDREPWGWKDPRNCLTLPFWQTMLGPVPVVIVVRNPLEVAKSLRVRNGFSYALGLALWQAYNQRVYESVAPNDRVVTHYDMYFHDPESELRRLLKFLALPVDEGVLEQVRSVHVAGLRHHQMTTRDLRFADVSPEILDLYHNLCTEAQWRDARFRSSKSETVAALTEAMVRSGDDPDSPESAVRAHRRSVTRERSSRRRQDRVARALTRKRESKGKRNGWLLPGPENSGEN